MTDSQIYKEICLSKNPQSKWNELLINKPQFFAKEWHISNKCRVTGEVLNKNNFAQVAGYWFPYTIYPIRKDLKQAYQKEQAYECQLIDTSCNDCLNYERDSGKCKKFLKVVPAPPNTCQPQNAKCFIHRKDDVLNKISLEKGEENLFKHLRSKGVL